LFGFIALLPWAGWEASRTSFDLTAQGIAAAAYLGVFVTASGRRRGVCGWAGSRS
jgi:drug/metabolite transporter (DMT)-like permease